MMRKDGNGYELFVGTSFVIFIHTHSRKPIARSGYWRDVHAKAKPIDRSLSCVCVCMSLANMFTVPTHTHKHTHVRTYIYIMCIIRAFI